MLRQFLHESKCQKLTKDKEDHIIKKEIPQNVILVISCWHNSAEEVIKENVFIYIYLIKETLNSPSIVPEKLAIY